MRQLFSNCSVTIDHLPQSFTTSTLLHIVYSDYGQNSQVLMYRIIHLLSKSGDDNKALFSISILNNGIADCFILISI